jgi:hypothetical protein
MPLYKAIEQSINRRRWISQVAEEAGHDILKKKVVYEAITTKSYLSVRPSLLIYLSS